MNTRRAFLAAACLAPVLVRAAQAPRFAADPFSLGVASGYPRPTGVVLWTRLAPKPLEGGGMDPDPVEVKWEVAEDEGFKRIVRTGAVVAVPEHAHSVHVEVDGLAPGRDYHYRFFCGEAASGHARTRTAPEAGRGDERLRLAIASCQQYEQGWFTAHRHLAAEGVDLVAFVGDYIYESSWGRDHVRRHGTAEPRTLGDYRDRYGLYKSDPDLKKSHAAAPWVVTWDDHEVDNDYANDRSEELDPSFLKRRAAAYKAFLEHMPLPRSMLLPGGGMRIYGHLEWGSLARLHILDARQYKSHQACPKPYRGGGNQVGAECTERLDPARSMLGLEQEKWLDAGLGESRAAWNLVMQQSLLAHSPRPSDKGPMHWTDGWEGYPEARARLLKSIVERKPANPVIFGGDVHAAYLANLHADPLRPDSPIVAAEFVATSITSQGPGAAANARMRQANPHIRYANGTVRGYGIAEIDRKGMALRTRAVASVKVPDAEVSTLGEAWVESGRPGLEMKNAAG